MAVNQRPRRTRPHDLHPGLPVHPSLLDLIHVPLQQPDAMSPGPAHVRGDKNLGCCLGVFGADPNLFEYFNNKGLELRGTYWSVRHAFPFLWLAFISSLEPNANLRLGSMGH